jgi:hypothetical protein
VPKQTFGVWAQVARVSIAESQQNLVMIATTSSTATFDNPQGEPTAAAARCVNCDTPLQGAYCHVCGQKAATQRFSLAHLLHEIPHAVFHVDRGFFATLRHLFTRVGGLVNDYLDGKRARYFNPFTLLVILAGLSGLLYSAFPFQFEAAAPTYVPAEDVARYREFLRLNFKYYSPSLLAYIPLSALITWLCFAGSKRNYGEHLIVNAFVTVGSTALMLLWFPLLVGTNGKPWFMLVWSLLTIVAIGYMAVAYFASFRPRFSKLSCGLRAACACFLYLVMVALVPVLLFPLVKHWL